MQLSLEKVGVLRRSSASPHRTGAASQAVEVLEGQAG